MALFGIGKTNKEEPQKPAASKGDGQFKNAEVKKTKTITNNNDSAEYKNPRHADILIHPLLTEKSTILSSQNQYVFSVGQRADKRQINAAIKEIYKVTPLKIRIIPVRGKKVRTGRNTNGYLKNWKKAIVTIPAGTKIDVYES
ncbi:50S ribosomal protein L23 [Candidatus Kuenenbacteria bacterium]|nr:50S ribosomal protein L23 [Candidatus Kuenenbacteria bacterium]